jgi:hypothetical protein
VLSLLHSIKPRLSREVVLLHRLFQDSYLGGEVGQEAMHFSNHLLGDVTSGSRREVFQVGLKRLDLKRVRLQVFLHRLQAQRHALLEGSVLLKTIKTLAQGHELHGVSLRFHARVPDLDSQIIKFHEIVATQLPARL